PRARLLLRIGAGDAATPGERQPDGERDANPGQGESAGARRDLAPARGDRSRPRSSEDRERRNELQEVMLVEPAAGGDRKPGQPEHRRQRAPDHLLARSQALARGEHPGNARGSQTERNLGRAAAQSRSRVSPRRVAEVARDGPLEERGKLAERRITGGKGHPWSDRARRQRV